VKHIITLFVALAFVACVPPQNAQQTTTPAGDDSSSAGDDSSSTDTYGTDDGTTGTDDGAAVPPAAALTCGRTSCSTDADCPSSCGACSSWSKTCLAF
jgi:hypothetical protein